MHCGNGLVGLVIACPGCVMAGREKRPGVELPGRLEDLVRASAHISWCGPLAASSSR